MKTLPWIRPSLRSFAPRVKLSASIGRPFATQIDCELFSNGAQYAFHLGDLYLAEALARPRQRDHADEHAARPEHRCGHRRAARIAFAERDIKTSGANGV